MGKFSEYPAANANDYANASTFLIQNDEGTTKLATLEGLAQTFFCSVYCASLTIPSADVLQLNSTPQTIVPAQGVGTAIELISASVKVDFNSAAYTSNTTLELIHSGAALGLKRSSTALGSTIANIVTFDTNVTPTTINTQMLENAALQVKSVTGNPATGDSDITVYVLYRIINV